jgi:hypothetical protein
MTDAPNPQAPAKPEQAAGHTTDVDTLRHLRVLEERFMNLRRKAQLTDDKLLSAEQKLNSELKTVNQELADMRRQFADLRENVTLLQAEMGHAARVHDIKALEKYLSYWEPLQFVTKEELMRKQNLLKQ